MTNDNLITMLILFLTFMVILLLTLLAVYFIMRSKNKRLEKIEEENAKNETGNKDVIQPNKEFTKESIFDFMDFEKIEDNMIIQKKGKFLMVIECQGINYDLMSDMEKISVEQGFLEFLNTLRYPIQLYIQTRTVNLEQSIVKYKEKLKYIEERYSTARAKYQQIKKSGEYTKQEEEKKYYEMIKQKNLYDYTKAIINDIEKTSLNSNVLNKKYYIILPYYYRDSLDAENYSSDEIQNIVFSELYTRARSIINTLSRCQVSGKILDSIGLIELLYSSYNREESDVLSAEKAINGGYEELYSTSPDIIDKKMKALEKEVERRALELANEKIEETKKEKEYRKKKENLNDLVVELAKGMIEHDKAIIGNEVADETIKKLEKNTKKPKEKGGNDNESVKEKGKRGRPRRITA